MVRSAADTAPGITRNEASPSAFCMSNAGWLRRCTPASVTTATVAYSSGTRAGVHGTAPATGSSPAANRRDRAGTRVKIQEIHWFQRRLTPPLPFPLAVVVGRDELAARHGRAGPAAHSAVEVRPVWVAVRHQEPREFVPHRAGVAHEHDVVAPLELLEHAPRQTRPGSRTRARRRVLLDRAARAGPAALSQDRLVDAGRAGADGGPGAAARAQHLATTEIARRRYGE